jgi:hypothetical protein
MTIEELKKKLIDECFNDNRYHIGDHWKFKADVFVLANPYGTWDIFYSDEKGNDQPYFKSFVEIKDACDYFYNFLNSNKYTKAHLLQTFETKDKADKFMANLNSNGINSELSLQPKTFNTKQYKIIVFGKDIVKAKNYLLKNT